MKKIIFIVLFCSFFSLCYGAEKEESSEKKDPLDYISRDSWATKSELFVFGGPYLADSLSNIFLGGMDYSYHFTKSIALGTSFAYSRAKYGSHIQLTQPGFFTDDNIYIIDATLMLPMPAAFRAGKATIEAELFAIVGAGTIHLNSSWKPQGFIGGGMKIFLFKPWFAIRVDMRTSMHGIDKPDGTTKFDTDLLMMVGASLQIPPKL